MSETFRSYESIYAVQSAVLFESWACAPFSSSLSPHHWFFKEHRAIKSTTDPSLPPSPAPNGGGTLSLQKAKTSRYSKTAEQHRRTTGLVWFDLVWFCYVSFRFVSMTHCRRCVSTTSSSWSRMRSSRNCRFNATWSAGTDSIACQKKKTTENYFSPTAKQTASTNKQNSKI